MSNFYKYLIVFLTFISLAKIINGESVWYEIYLKKDIIKPGEKGEAFLTIYPDYAPEAKIDFENTIIIGIDLKKADDKFEVKIHPESSKKDEEVYKIVFSSTTKGKNEFTITLYDYDNYKSLSLDPVPFEIGEEAIIEEEIVPDPKKTTLIKKPLEFVGENDTITFDFSLVDTKGKDITVDKDFLKKLKVKNNGKDVEDAKITPDGKTFNVALPTDYLPLTQSINVEFKGKNDTFNIFPDNLNLTVIVYPSSSKTKVNCKNCENITLNESLLIDLQLHNYKDVAVSTDDYSKDFKIVVNGLLDIEKNETTNYELQKVSEDENAYQLISKEDDVLIHSGTYEVKVYQNDTLIFEYEFTINPEDFDISKFRLEFIDEDFDPKKAFVDTKFGMVLKGYDCFGNPVPYPLSDDIKLSLENEDGKKIKYKDEYDDNESGKFKMYITSETLGKAKLKLYFKGKEIAKINIDQDLPEFIFNLMKCIKSVLTKDELDSAIVGKDVTFYLQCIDKLGKTVKRGGEKFTSDNYFISDGKFTSFEVNIHDLQSGNYSFNFIPSSEGNYFIKIYLDDELFLEVDFEIEKMRCKDSTPFLCPNKNLCVSNRIECIEPKNDCPENTPFYCKSQKKYKCVESQTECDCPTGYIRCDYMKYCVPEGRPDMCADFSEISEKTCSKMKQFNNLCSDGICRLDKKLSPSQIVCPIGKVLCADLSCRDKYDDCAISDFCPEGQIRCPDQSCVDDYTECPSTVSCQNKKFVCPDNSCVDNEIECDALPICSGDEPYRCHDNLCVKDQFSCVSNVPCGQKMALCNDLICRISCDDF